MNDVELYLEAATRKNTQRSYLSAVRHFEVEWGGFLPATPDSLACYLAHYAGSLAVNTLQQRVAALAQWHIDQGFPDPTVQRQLDFPLASIKIAAPYAAAAGLAAADFVSFAAAAR